MLKEHLIINKENSIETSWDGSHRSVKLHSEGTPSWLVSGQGVKTLTVEKNMVRGHMHLELEEINKETGRGKVTMLSLNKETAETLVAELINFLGEK